VRVRGTLARRDPRAAAGAAGDSGVRGAGLSWWGSDNRKLCRFPGAQAWLVGPDTPGSQPRIRAGADRTRAPSRPGFVGSLRCPTAPPRRPLPPATIARGSRLFWIPAAPRLCVTGSVAASPSGAAVGALAAAIPDDHDAWLREMTVAFGRDFLYTRDEAKQVVAAALQ